MSALRARLVNGRERCLESEGLPRRDLTLVTCMVVSDLEGLAFVCCRPFCGSYEGVSGASECPYSSIS